MKISHRQKIVAVFSPTRVYVVQNNKVIYKYESCATVLNLSLFIYSETKFITWELLLYVFELNS